MLSNFSYIWKLLVLIAFYDSNIIKKALMNSLLFFNFFYLAFNSSIEMLFLHKKSSNRGNFKQWKLDHSEPERTWQVPPQ